MNTIVKRPIEELGYGFIEKEFLPEGKDEFYLRELQQTGGITYRGLQAHEIEILVKNDNTADDWNDVFVTQRFNPELVKACEFHGRVRIGDLERFYLEFHDLRMPVGLYNSTIVSCDIGNNVVIDSVGYLAHYIIGNEVVLLDINEMHTTNHAKFGYGTLKEGEAEEVRIWLEVGNENGGRKVLPFDGLLPGDAYLWSKYRDDEELMGRFLQMTDALVDPRRGFYGTVGDRSIIKDCRILKDVRIGKDAYIKGANKLKNLTINSDAEASTQIGEGVELVNGIIGQGCRIFYGVKAVRFLLGSNSSLKYGARLINSILGDNSTISCCEVLNSLIFPGHEQHHNNSFLCAATVLGQSNVAAGATIGSNHNSRGSDGEIRAGRGFWPGLCVNLKHNSRFASFTLLVKGSYPAELDVRLPFSLVSNNESEGRLQILPAYWFLYNMYALARNAWKYHARDKRVHKEQLIEFDYLAPDTVEEVFRGLSLLEEWVGKAYLREHGSSVEESSRAQLRKEGRRVLRELPGEAARLVVFAERVEATRRPVVVLKAAAAYATYREMVSFYGVKTLMGYAVDHGLAFEELVEHMGLEPRGAWVNAGGQLIRESDLETVKQGIISGDIASWEDLHAEYIRLGELYPVLKARHAFASLLEIEELDLDRLDLERWHALLDSAESTMRHINDLTVESRTKDYTNPFRKIAYDSQEEMNAVIGTIEDDAFIAQIAEQTENFAQTVERAKELG